MIVPRFSSSLLLFVSLAASLPAADLPFESATRPPYSRPPQTSINGKQIADMREAVKKEWSKIQFKKNGKPVEYVVTLDTDAGQIQVEFYPNEAPSHVRSFVGLTKAGFYDGLIFHRCIPGFVIQGGCPNGDGTGGPAYCVKQEFNERKHKRGALSMARSRPVDSGGSQFFVCVADVSRSLDIPGNRYTVFGHVTKGMDVVDRIVAAPTKAQGFPVRPVKINKATVSIKGAK